MRRVAVAAALLVGSLPGAASAAGFYIGDIGARGMGRAGAFVAAPDSLLAAHYNPAGLSLLKGFHAELSVAAVAFDSTFQRRCPCTDPNTEGAAGFDMQLESGFGLARTNTPLAIPFVAVGYGFDWLDTTVALAAYGPNSGRHDWGELPPTGSPRYPTEAAAAAQRYRALDVNNLEANITLGLSFSPLPGLRIGGSAFVFAAGSNQGLTLFANFASLNDRPEDTRFDVPVQFRLQTTWALNWGVGASWDIIEGLTLGTSFRGKRSIRGQGKIEAQIPRLFLNERGEPEGASIDGEDAQIELDVAPVWRTGLQYRLPGVFLVEAALVYEGWSTHDRILARPQGVSFTVQGTTTEIPTLVFDRQWKDTWAVRLGGEVDLLRPWVGLRGGYFYETSAIPGERVDVARIDRPKHGVSLGAATTWAGVTLEVSGMYVYLVPNDTSTSEVQQTAAFADGDPLGSREYVTTVGNGRIEGHYWVGSVSLSFSLDAVSADPSPPVSGRTAAR